MDSESPVREASGEDRKLPPWAKGYRHLTEDLTGVEFRTRVAPEDFRVEELPKTEPCGEGTHLWFRMRKRGISTRSAIARLAQALDRKPGEFGVAGLKDADAVTEQLVSIEHCDPSALLDLGPGGHGPGDLEILDPRPHGRKLKLGHHNGNRFTIRLRGAGAAELPRIESILEVLRVRGLPNAFGPQRFGWAGRSHQLGRLLVEGDLPSYVTALVSVEHSLDPALPEGDERRARSAALVDFAACLAEERKPTLEDLRSWRPCLPRELHPLLAQARRRRGDPEGLVRSLDRGLLRLHQSAFQARAFNAVLMERISTVDRVEVGDLACFHGSGAQFEVTDPVAEAPRVRNFEISATGPLPGGRMDRPSGDVGELEARVLIEEGWAADPRAPKKPSAENRGGGRGRRGFQVRSLPGERRPLRVPVPTVRAETDGPGGDIVLRFDLPPGSYATALLEELAKNYR